MAYSTTNLYPEDLNGTNPANLITNEPQTLQVPGPLDFYFIIPKAAPFFVDSLVVKNAANNQAYVPGKDYQVGHLFIEAMNSTGRPIAGSIRFMRDTIQGQVLLTYRTVGGDWGFDDAAILRELANKQLNPLTRSWGDIAPLPYSFPPLPHDQRVDSLVGSDEINKTLEDIAKILEAANAETSQSHLTNYNNPHRVTAAQVGLGNVPNYRMASDAQHLLGDSANLFTNPLGVKNMITAFAVDPLNKHISNTSNPHKVTPTQLGLGNVPNYKVANNQEAVDPVNNTTFMTPYTVTLAIQKMQSDPRIDNVIARLDEHLVAYNPHGITPAMIGTYTRDEIDVKVNQAAGGSNASSLGGESAAVWDAKFPKVADINDILESMMPPWEDAFLALEKIDLTEPKAASVQI